MSNINLAIGNQENRNNKRPPKKGMVIAIIALTVTIIVYGGLIVLQKKVAAQVQVAKSQYQIKYKKVLAGKVNDVLDFKNRTSVAKKMLAQREDMNEILNNIESAMIPAVHLESLNYDKTKNIILLNCISGSFYSVARQILSFKEDSFFITVVPGNNFLDTQTGEVHFIIKLKLK